MKLSKWVKSPKHGSVMRQLIESSSRRGVSIRVHGSSVNEYLDSLMYHRDIELAREGMRGYR